MGALFQRLKAYIILVRAYSIIDVVLLFLLAHSFSNGNNPLGLREVVGVAITLFLWAVLTLSLEAKHKHAYRAYISYLWPVLFAALATGISLFFNFESVIFVFLVVLFTDFYIKKETNMFWGATSSIWRGLYQSSLFFFCLSLYKTIGTFTIPEIMVGVTICFLHISRNLIADVRDVAFDRLTFTVQYGNKKTYLITLFSFLAGATLLLSSLKSLPIIVPLLMICTILLFYDDGFVLHRVSIMVTSFTFVNTIFFLKGASLLYPNLLFLGILSNLLFYEKVARPSNPIPRVPHQARFLLFSQK